MLRFTFRHLPGIGPKKEVALWRAGVTSLEALLERRANTNRQLNLFGAARLGTVEPIAQSVEALMRGDVAYFARSLDPSEQYRVVLTYPEETLFLDIETTGLSHYYDRITLVGWALGGEYGCWIRGNSPAPLYDVVARAKALVTFNGTLFDLPFVRTEFPDLPLPVAHVDLRFFGRRVGLKGSQKEIEQRLRIRRPRTIAKLRGEAAPLLWYEYTQGDRKACAQLIHYNKADIDGMQKILNVAIRAYLEDYGVPDKLARAVSYRFAPSKLRSSSLRIPSPGAVRRSISAQPIRLRDLINDVQCRFVGIDLTGAERRPSGWALLAGTEATTRRLGADVEILEATLAARPTLVSIDSPLSLPRGRIMVSDDDPGRSEFGILRECERVLHKRGVNVYPSLIRSMQALTARGIRLATELRKLGIPTIESFPGAAQDIMGIPRKRKDLRLLSQGLHDFGVRGSFTHLNVSHDELDAITSAVVAAFFWGGRFEALGNPDEEYLIIPSRELASRWQGKCVIGLSGPINAGKTTAGELLANRGYAYTRFSLVLRAILEARGEPPTREALQQLGLEVHERGQRWLDAQLLASIPRSDRVVVDGLRWPEDHAYLVESFGPVFRHLYVDADEQRRRDRYIASGGNAYTFDKFLSHPVESQTLRMKLFSHGTINNDGTVDDLWQQLASHL